MIRVCPKKNFFLNKTSKQNKKKQKISEKAWSWAVSFFSGLSHELEKFLIVIECYNA